jgi:hypothetical protein
MNPFKYTEMEWVDMNELPEDILEGIGETIKMFKDMK